MSEEGRPIDGPARPPHPTQNLVLRVVTEDAILDKSGRGQAMAERRVELLDYMPIALQVGDPAFNTLLVMCKFSSTDSAGRLVCELTAQAIGDLRGGFGRQAIGAHIARLKDANILRSEGEREPGSKRYTRWRYVIYPFCDAPCDNRRARPLSPLRDTGRPESPADDSGRGNALHEATAKKDDTGLSTVVSEPVAVGNDSGHDQEDRPVPSVADDGSGGQSAVEAADQISMPTQTDDTLVTLIRELMAHKVEPGVAARLAKSNPAECRRQLDLLPQREGVHNPGGYLVKAIEGAYAPPKPEQSSARPGSPAQPDEPEAPWYKAAEAVFDAFDDSERERRIEVERQELLGAGGATAGASERILRAMAESNALFRLAVELGLANEEEAA